MAPVSPDPSAAASVPATGPNPAAPAETAATGAAHWSSVVAALLLALYAALAVTASWRNGVSFDEGVQLAVGYNVWRHGDFRMENANGDFVKRWATLPYLVSRPRLPGYDSEVLRRGDAYGLAHRFLFESGNNPESLLAQARAMVVLLGVAAGTVVFLAARALFGPAGGLVALSVFTFSPNLLAFGGIASTDLSITLLLLGATLAIWRLLHLVTVPRLAASLAVFALLVLAKPTALVILPVTAVLLAVKLAARTPLELRWRGAVRTVAARRPQLAVFALCIALHAVAGWTSLWAHYGFRFDAAPPVPGIVQRPGRTVVRDDTPALLLGLLGWAEQERFLPLGFLRGVELLAGNDDELGAFMRGEWMLGGRLEFFPYAIWVKTPPPTLLLIALGAGAWAWARLRGGRGPPLYAATPLLALVGCHLAIAVADDLNIGHRHILPIYPPLDILAGAVVLLPWRALLRRALVAGLLAWLAVESFAVRPHYLAYFAPQAGGPARGYKHLVDSSLDWGMNLPGLRAWLDEHDPHRRTPLYLAYFGTDDPRHYGIRARLLPGFADHRPVELYPLGPGYYAVSASLLQGVYTAAFGPWSKAYEELYRASARNVAQLESAAGNPARLRALYHAKSRRLWQLEIDTHDNLRFARLCAWLRHRGEPPHHVGHSIFIWKLTAADLAAALEGPPAELTDGPPVFRRLRAL